jgi:hypothetical protein
MAESTNPSVVIQDLIHHAEQIPLDELETKANDLYKQFKDDPNLAILFLVIGTLLHTKNPYCDKAIEWLRRSTIHKKLYMNNYQLAYLLEYRVRKSRNLKEIMEMIEQYAIARIQEAKASCQLGSYWIDFPDDAKLLDGCNENDGLIFAEKLLISAYQKKIPQAIIHLVRLYKRLKNYDNIVHCLKLKYMQTRDIMDLMELSLLLLNKGDYFNYCIIMKQLNQPVKNVSAFLKPGSFIAVKTKEECCVCLTQEPNTRTLICKHHVCDNCLLSMFENNLRCCPICKTLLCADQNDSQKQCVANMLAEDDFSKFTQVVTFTTKK